MIEHARVTLFDDHRMCALPRSDLELLRTAFDAWAAEVRDRQGAHQTLHGEPHLANVVVTDHGPVLIDFEAVSHGPLEWDLASMDPGVAELFGETDRELLMLTRRLNSARVATWGWARAEYPSMRRAGEHHLAIVRQAAAS